MAVAPRTSTPTAKPAPQPAAGADGYVYNGEESPLIVGDNTDLKKGDLVGFCINPREVVPAIIEKLNPDGRHHLKATILTTERYRNRNPESMEIYLRRVVASERLYLRARQFDPPVVGPGGGDFPLDSFTCNDATCTAKEPGGPLTSGTWFDLRPWVVSITATRFEIKDKHGMIEVPGEQRAFGPFDGAAFRQAYETFDRERREGGWDRVDVQYSLKSSM